MESGFWWPRRSQERELVPSRTGISGGGYEEKRRSGRNTLQLLGATNEWKRNASSRSRVTSLSSRFNQIALIGSNLASYRNNTEVDEKRGGYGPYDNKITAKTQQSLKALFHRKPCPFCGLCGVCRTIGRPHLDLIEERMFQQFCNIDRRRHDNTRFSWALETFGGIWPSGGDAFCLRNAA